MAGYLTFSAGEDYVRTSRGVISHRYINEKSKCFNQIIIEGGGIEMLAAVGEHLVLHL